MMEEWCEFVEGYEVSNFGRVRNIKTNYIRTPQKRHKATEHFSVHIKGKNYSVSRLVATYFVPNPENYPIVRHWDGNAENNHHTNLKWGTQKDNTDDSFRHGTHTSLTSESYAAQQNERNKPSKVKRKKRNNLPLGVFEVKSKKGTRYHARFANTTIGYIGLGTHDTIYEAFQVVKVKYFEIYGVYPDCPEPEPVYDAIKVKSAKHKLNATQALEIKNSSVHIKELAIIYNVSVSCITDIKNGYTWKHL